MDSSQSDHKRMAATLERLRRVPLDIQTRTELVNLYIAKGLPGEALRQISIMEKLGGSPPRLQTLKSRALIIQQRENTRRHNTLEKLRQNIERDPKDASSSIRILTMLRESSLDESILCGKQFVEAIPDSLELRVLLTELLLQACVYDQAESHALALVEMAPQFQRGYVLAGRSMMRIGRNQEAAALFAHAAQLGHLSEGDALLFDKACQNNEVRTGSATNKPSQPLQLHNDSIAALNTGYSTRFEEVRQYMGRRRFQGKCLRILSFGCSVGNEVGLLKKAFPDALIFGCDVDESSLQIASANQSDVRTTIFRSNPENLAKYGPFDVITCMSVLCRYPASEYIDDMSGYLPFSQFEAMLDIIDGSLRIDGVLVLWNAVYPFSQTRQSPRYDNLPSKIVGLNGYTSLFHPTGHRLTRFMRDGALCAQEILSDKDLDLGDLTSVLRRKLAEGNQVSYFNRLWQQIRGGTRKLLEQCSSYSPVFSEGEPEAIFIRALDFSAIATELQSRAETCFGLHHKPYIASSFGVEIYRHSENPICYQGRWHYALTGTALSAQTKNSSILREMSANDVATFLS